MNKHHEHAPVHKAPSTEHAVAADQQLIADIREAMLEVEQSLSTFRRALRRALFAFGVEVAGIREAPTVEETAKGGTP